MVLHPFLHVLSSQYCANTSGIQLKILLQLSKMFLNVSSQENVVKKATFFFIPFPAVGDFCCFDFWREEALLSEQQGKGGFVCLRLLSQDNTECKGPNQGVLLLLLCLPVMCHLPVLEFMVRKEAEVANATRLGTNSN